MVDDDVVELVVIPGGPSIPIRFDSVSYSANWHSFHVYDESLEVVRASIHGRFGGPYPHRPRNGRCAVCGEDDAELLASQTGCPRGVDRLAAAPPDRASLAAFSAGMKEHWRAQKGERRG